MTLDVIAGDPAARWVSLLGPAATLAERIATTDFVPKAMRNNPAAIAAAILYGDEIGIGPMQALNGIHVVEGRPAPSAELMRAMILRAGHHLTVHEISGTRARVSGLRNGRPEEERTYVEWTLDQARAAGLLNRPNWKSYPRAMLVARATGDLARVAFPDVIKGLGYVSEDDAEALESWGPPDAPAAEEAPKPARKALQRARRPKAPTDLADAPEAPPLPPPDVPDEEYLRLSREAAKRAAEDAADTPRPGEADSPARPSGRGPYDPEDVPLPAELMPDSGPVEVAPPGNTITPGPLRALHAALTKELGTVATVEERRDMLAAILGHPVESSKALTREEGYAALDFLGRVANGTAAYTMDTETGAIKVVDP